MDFCCWLTTRTSSAQRQNPFMQWWCNPLQSWCNESGCPDTCDRSQFVMIAEGETTAEAAAACGWRSFSYQGGSNGADRADYAAVKECVRC